MNAPAGRSSGNAWDASWSSPAGDAVEPLDAPTLANHIDCSKLAFMGTDLPNTGRALEIGCGSARLLVRTGATTSLRLVALDPSPGALVLAARTAALADLPLARLRGDGLALPFPDGAFDLVLSGGLLEHFREPEGVLEEMVRVLRPGGTFYADVVPRRFSLYRSREAWRMLRSPWLMPEVYESTFGPGRYRDALERLGCTRIRIRAAGVYPPGSGPSLAARTAVLDGTFVADLLGWYFMILARREGDSIRPRR